MPVETRGKDKESESLFDKVRLLSPASQHGQGAESRPIEYRLDHTSQKWDTTQTIRQCTLSARSC